MTVIENEYLKVAIRSKGGEMTSIYNKATGIEHLWQGNPEIWGWHAPNLFPVVGGLIDNQLHVDGQSYPMQRHGFIRPTEMRLGAETTKQHALFSLPYSAETLAAYPFKFNYQIIYDLIDNALRVTYKVINMDNKAIWFSVGGHPAFNIPFNNTNTSEEYEDYYLEFETPEKLETHLLSAEGFFTGQTESVPLDGAKLHLNRHLFDHDALVFKKLNSRQITIKSKNHDHSISVEFPHFNYLGIWAKPGADFVCIEPWLGCADDEGAPTDITKKDGIQKLEQGHVFEAAFYVSV